MRTKICLLLLVVALLLSGCVIAREVNRTTEVVEAVVTAMDYDPPSLRPIRVGKVTTFQRIPADYDLTVEYNGTTANVDVDEDEYEQFEIGDTIVMNYITITYDNGEVRYRLERSD